MHTFIKLLIKVLKELGWTTLDIPEKIINQDIFLIGTYSNRITYSNDINTDYKDDLNSFRVLCYVKKLHIAIAIVSKLNGSNVEEGAKNYQTYSTLDDLIKSYNHNYSARD